MSLKEIFVFLSLILSFVRTAWFSDDGVKLQVTPAAYRISNAAAADDNVSKKEYSVAMGKRLSIHLKTGGSIDISGWDREKVTIETRISGDPEDLIVESQQTSDGIEISSRYTHSTNYNPPNIYIELRVPSRFDVDLQTMGGDVSIRSVEGSFSGRTMGGELDLKDLKGNIDMTTMGGGIQLTNSTLDGKLKTMGGDVRFQNVSGNVQGSSMGGNVNYENVRRSSESPAQKNVQLTSMGGDLEISDAPNGADLNTMGGDIRVASAAKYVKANTMGGDIVLNQIDGWIDATTMAGDIQAKMTGDPAKGKRDVTLSSQSGDVELTLPEKFSGSFDVEIDCGDGLENRCKITSDFPLQISEEKRTFENHRKNHYGFDTITIHGKGQVAGGTHTVKIHTVNGNITIRKAGTSASI